MPNRSLGELYSRFVVRTSNLVWNYDYVVPTAHISLSGGICKAVHINSRAQIIVKLILLWGEFSRSLIIKSAIGNCHTIGGNLIKPSAIASTTRDIKKIIDKLRGNRPTAWHIPHIAVEIAKELSVQNYDQILLGLSGISKIDDLRIIRNHIVHPNRETRIEYENIAWKLGYQYDEPASILAIRVQGGASLLESWVLDFQQMALESVR